MSTLPTGRPNPSSATSPSRVSAPAQIATATVEEPTAIAAAMLSTMSASSTTVAEAMPADQAPNAFDDAADNGSSSLSELGDASDDQSELTPRQTPAADLDEDDSEAETERLDNTPRKLARTVPDTPSLSESAYTRTSSKLAHSKIIDHDGSTPATPSALAHDAPIDAAVTSDNPLHSLSLIATTEAASLEHVGKKRKRASAEGSPMDEQDEEEPLRKRSEPARNSALDGLADAAADRQGRMDADEELENAEENLSALAREELELEERQANIAAQVAKHTKPRKGGRRGKRKVEDTSHAYTEPFVAAETQEGEAEGDHEEEDSSVLDEEVTKKKIAIDELAKIEKKFKLFREK